MRVLDVEYEERDWRNGQLVKRVHVRVEYEPAEETADAEVIRAVITQAARPTHLG